MSRGEVPEVLAALGALELLGVLATPGVAAGSSETGG
jgi:hypothetical protein